jgi:ribonuclease D
VSAAGRPDLVVVETPEGLARLAARLAASPRVALDTEADSLHAYRERVCVVQASVEGLDAIVDPLVVTDLSPLAALVARDDVEIVLHGGDYDVSILSRDHGFRFVRVFDTMIAATLLGEERVGLSALVEALTGTPLDKRFQKADWGARPLTPAQLEYLRADTAHLLALREVYGRRLAEADLVEEAEIEFRRLAARRGVEKGDDPEAWRRVKGAEALDDLGRAVFRALHAWREGRARERDVPPFRVVGNETLLAMAARPPANRAALRESRGWNPAERERAADVLLRAIDDAVEATRRGAAPPRSAKRPLLPEERARLAAERRREESLRRWRTGEAERRGVVNAVVLPNPALEAIAALPPSSVEALAAMPDVGPKRAARYGAAILAALRG